MNSLNWLCTALCYFNRDQNVVVTFVKKIMSSTVLKVCIYSHQISLQVTQAAQENVSQVLHIIKNLFRYKAPENKENKRRVVRAGAAPTLADLAVAGSVRATGGLVLFAKSREGQQELSGKGRMATWRSRRPTSWLTQCRVWPSRRRQTPYISGDGDVSLKLNIKAGVFYVSVKEIIRYIRHPKPDANFPFSIQNP
ncbi:hypothetical protein GUJ93_ZPchr0006g41402 [Zizania palustris]|uniref:Uncharacterized protein n=1 Tax=Zizania palustris TaxID=103762 RepID=A0A8J5SIJ2_ZIZPA|nr:hypothetical protein GUJ93_ZPchr0006g41402 [Zizania palustris]